MPPLKGIDRGIDGKMLKALEETGHGDQIAVVDASYSIPKGADIVDYHGDSSARALNGILDLVPVDETEVAVVMSADPGTPGSLAGPELEGAFEDHGVESGFHFRNQDNDSLGKAFYDLANASPDERPTLFVRTRDERAYACALFVVGHSQQ